MDVSVCGCSRSRDGDEFFLWWGWGVRRCRAAVILRLKTVFLLPPAAVLKAVEIEKSKSLQCRFMMIWLRGDCFPEWIRSASVGPRGQIMHFEFEFKFEHNDRVKGQ